MRRLRLLPVLTLLLASGALAQGAPPRLYAVRDGSALTYKLIHKMHTVEGTAKKAEGKARLLPDGTLQVAVRAAVKDFDSGNGNRDAHMQETVEAARFPHVELKGLGKGVQVPAKLPATVPVTLQGKLTFHGVTRDVSVPLQVTFKSAKDVEATGQLALSLEAHGVQRPSLLMVKVEDALKVDVALKLAAEGAK